MVVHVSLSILVSFEIISLHFWKGDVCSGILYLFLSKYLWRNVHRKAGGFSSVLWYLLVPLLCNSSSAGYRLEYHEAWIRSSLFLKTAKELLLINFFTHIKCSLFRSISLLIYLELCHWSQHIRNRLEPSIWSAPVKFL